MLDEKQKNTKKVALALFLFKKYFSKSRDLSPTNLSIMAENTSQHFKWDLSKEEVLKSFYEFEKKPAEIILRDVITQIFPA